MATRATSDSSSTETSLRLRFDAFALDEADASLTRDGKRISLAPRPFEVLCVLARTPQTLVTKNALLDSVWGHRFVTESVLKTTVSALRAALGDDSKQPRYIETVSRRGYRFIAKVNAGAAPNESPPAISSSALEPSGSRLSITGRSDAVERLRSAWQLACSGKRQIVWIAGEPGVGKSTLIEHFVAEVGESQCVHGQCVEQSGAGEPYLPALEALSALSRRDPSFGELIRAVAPTWLLQLPWLSSAEERDALRRELAGSGQARMLREFGELLERYTQNRPLLLVTEDLHWSDHATVQLIDHIARRRPRHGCFGSPASELRKLWRRIIRSNHCATNCGFTACPTRSCSTRFPKKRWPLTSRQECQALRSRKNSCARCMAAPTGCLCSWPTS
jgi:DNA-binding winged helix-turn-helix (wHTH) protein